MAGTKRKAETAAAAAVPRKKTKPAPASLKRKAADATDHEPSSKKAKKGPIISEPPSERLNVYVFGEGMSPITPS